MNNSYIYIYHVNVTQTVPDISPLMPMHQDPLLVYLVLTLITVFVLYNITARQGPLVAELVNQVTWYFLYVWLPLQHPSGKPQCQ